MIEQKIPVDPADVMELYGVNNSNIQFLGHLFPHLRLIARGTDLRVIGEEEQLEQFAGFFARL